MTISETGLVFDIKRFAVHDGDGIRTTVFLKGCPLRCRWCQNPEGLEPERSILYLKSRCMHCGCCRRAAVHKEVGWNENGPVPDRSFRGSFENVIRACPTGALTYDSESYTLEALMDRIRADRVFYRENGGVTFSGGEPLLQGEFLLEVLKRCRKEGIQTAVETSLYVNPETLRKVIPFLDRIFADVKILDGKRHEELTGRGNGRILENVRLLLESQARERVIIRTPLIPNMTASEENIRGIAAFIAGIDPDVRYELLNYNVLAPAKYEMTGRTYGLETGLKQFREEEMERFRHAAEEGGVVHLIRETKVKGN